jgi:hypothetical protein
VDGEVLGYGRTCKSRIVKNATIRRTVMGKRILVLAASPREGGNSDILCGEFIKGAEETRHESKKLRPQHLGVVDYLKDVAGVFDKKQWA